VLGEYAIKLYLVPKSYTGVKCSACCEIHRSGSIYRGLYIYAEKHGRT